MADATPDQRAAITAGLRDLADFLDTHPELPLDAHDNRVTYFPHSGDDAADRAEINRIAAVLGLPPEPSPAGGHYEAARGFGPVFYKAIAVPARELAQHQATQSYAGAVTPDPPHAA